MKPARLQRGALRFGRYTLVGLVSRYRKLSGNGEDRPYRVTLIFALFVWLALVGFIAWGIWSGRIPPIEQCLNARQCMELEDVR